MNFETIAQQASAVIRALAPVLEVAVPETGPALKVALPVIQAMLAGEQAAAALVAQVHAGTDLTAEQVRGADVALDGAAADLLADIDAADRKP